MLGVRSEELLILYAGNMGTMQDVEPLLAAVRHLRQHPLRFLLVGGGTRTGDIARLVEEHKLDNVQLLPYQSEARFRRILAAADVGFVALKPGMERYGFPSRGLTFLSAGLPLLALMEANAEIAQLVRACGCGWNPTTTAELIDIMERLATAPEWPRRLRERSKTTYRTHFGRDGAADAYFRVLFGEPSKAENAAPGVVPVTKNGRVTVMGGAWR